MSTPILSKKAVVVNFSFSQTSSFFRQKTEGELPSVKMVVGTDQDLDKQHVGVIHRSQQIECAENNVDAGTYGDSHMSYATDECAAQSLFAFDVVYNILLDERSAASYLDDNAYFITPFALKFVTLLAYVRRGIHVLIEIPILHERINVMLHMGKNNDCSSD